MRRLLGIYPYPVVHPAGGECTRATLLTPRSPPPGTRNMVRHAQGWTPTHAPDGTTLLEQYVEIALDTAEPLAAVEEAVPVAPTRTFDTLVRFESELVAPALATLAEARSRADPVLQQTCKMFEKALDKIIGARTPGPTPVDRGVACDAVSAKWMRWVGSLGEDAAHASLKAKLVARQAECQPLFEAKTPPNLKDLLYEVMSSLRGDRLAPHILPALATPLV